MMASLALPLAFQLWTPLLGMTWLRWFTRPGVVTGVSFGIIGVMLTEPFGISVLSAFGLELPWGRAPWTINSAAWGIAANLIVTMLVSAFTQRRAFGEEAQEARHFLYGILHSAPPGPFAAVDSMVGVAGLAVVCSRPRGCWQTRFGPYCIASGKPMQNAFFEKQAA